MYQRHTERELIAAKISNDNYCCLKFKLCLPSELNVILIKMLEEIDSTDEKNSHLSKLKSTWNKNAGTKK